MKNLISLLLAVIGLTTAAVAKPGDPITYAISLTSSVYDAQANHTTFTYSVTSNPNRGPAISHWVIGITSDCGGADAFHSSNDSAASWTNADPTTGLRGVKFDTGYNDGASRVVTVTLAGQWGTGPVSIAVKSGNGFVLGTVDGPSCTAVEPSTYVLSGQVFFDVNYSGVLNPDEPGLGGVTVTLIGADGEVAGTTTTAADGSYSFEVLPGDYTVVIGGVNGLAPTTLNEHDVTVAASDLSAPDTGYGLNFAAIGTMSANGFTIGFWKNNLEKALKGTTKGVQVSAATLSSYTTVVGGLALEPFAGITPAQAVATLSVTGSQPTLLLSKQLLASEYNYANGAYLNGDANLTKLFIYYGEYLLKHSTDYTSAYLLNAKDWFDAYNNTHGGLVIGPAL